ncbi:LysR family transcriptional regulator [Ramlibacter tataouinensis]|uniref:LysR family transcriptional regulator n=1 Tax=Ramlibacter tataouinensis TaxID=94132 RepID=A0A127JZU8_9BURK|nr:LysR family transcriptional regulator [Ramlibacter tataouinensis]
MIAQAQYRLTAADLEALLALARAGTLAEAAARLQADASTVFRTVQRVEKNLGQRLFERSRGGYLASDTMLEIARHAERIESELEAARAAAAGSQRELAGRVRITTTDSVLRGLVLPALRPLAAEHPRLQLEVTSTNELMSLTRRDADIALRATPKPPGHLVGRNIGTIRFAICAARSMPASQRRKAFDALAWIAPDDAMPEHPSVRWRRKQWPRLAPALLVDGIVGVVDAIGAGLGIGIVPLFMLANQRELVALSPPLESCESQLWLLAHPESRHLRRIAATYQHLAATLRLPDKLAG